MRTAEDNDMIQTFTPDRTDQAFYIRRLPKRTGRAPEFLQIQSLGDTLEFQAINAIPVAQQVFCG